MKKLIVLAQLMLLVSTTAIADTKQDSTSVRIVGARMQHLLWMCGTWEGHYGDEIVRLRANLASNGQAIVYDVETGTSSAMMMPAYHGMYYWDAGSQSYALTQVDLHSSITQGRFRYTDTTKAEQTTTVRSENGEQQVHSEYAIYPNRFEVKSWVRNSDADPWIPARDVVYTRVKPAQ